MGGLVLPCTWGQALLGLLSLQPNNTLHIPIAIIVAKGVTEEAGAKEISGIKS